ncbi:helix-turn-helix domain-containing protein [Nonomuraea spiralis]|uniref:Helix-turn-helix domain-containing protein n=1 Tax=Nonomuraea spiralis TaxID=46182 RepID=A0ABV5IYH2_9ACTN|nr:helix-turn-helix domain-containing protein [Nonomuraea spiralis]GGS88394.1 hypothetical protein GCM10010176_035200 [Nonomuraea spiralis]
MPSPPLTDDERQQIRDLHAAGHGCNAIARQLGRDRSTISRAAQGMGLDFDRKQTREATQARRDDNAARRTRIITNLYDVIEDDLVQLKTAGHQLAEVSMGKVVRYEVDRLPAQDRKALLTAISSAATTAVRLEQVDASDGADQVASLLGTLFDGLRAKHGTSDDDPAAE